VLAQQPQAAGTAIRTLAMGPQLPAPPMAGDDDEAELRKPAIALDRLPTGRDFVKGELLRDADDPKGLRVRLRIAPGWHVNANPASLDFLIPTRVEPAKPGVSVEIGYPEGREYHPRFSLEPLSVYEGEVDIRLRTETSSGGDSGFDLTFQACDASSCLPPETVRLKTP
jgi:hypothetical protein